MTSAYQKKTTSRFNLNSFNLKEADNFSNFQKSHLNKVFPVKKQPKSNKSMTPEKVRSEKANDSSLYDHSIKGGSVKEKLSSVKNFG